MKNGNTHFQLIKSQDTTPNICFFIFNWNLFSLVLLLWYEWNIKKLTHSNIECSYWFSLKKKKIKKFEIFDFDWNLFFWNLFLNYLLPVILLSRPVVFLIGSLNIDAVIGSKLPSTIADCGLWCLPVFWFILFLRFGIVDGDNLLVSFSFGIIWALPIGGNELLLER